MAIFRPHRGGLEQSMKEAVEVFTLDDLVTHLNKLYQRWDVELALDDIKLEPYASEYLVAIRSQKLFSANEPGYFGAVGFTDGPLEKARKWRCFFCDEVFTSYKDAAKHFGRDDACEADVPACKIKEHEGHLVHYIRKLENELRQRMSDDSDVMRAMMTLEVNHAQALKEAEEKGYARGVADMKKQGYCAEPAKHE